MNKVIEINTTCYHCGQACETDTVSQDDKNFCCRGCQMVYEILNENNLCEYYSYQNSPGVSLRYVAEESYSYLDDESVKKKIVSFDSATYSSVQFYIPTIHCISCIWLLENLQRLNEGIVKSEINFSQKRATIHFNPSIITLGAVARLLASLGYSPTIRLEEQQLPTYDRSLVIKLAVAGFCFGNIMLLSFPEYLGLDGSDEVLKKLFSYLNWVLSIPVVVYSGKDYFISAAKSFRQKQINIDVPIAAGLLTLFVRSSYDIFTYTGSGYFDSLSGLVFFLLIGRWFQNKTYDSLSFDRDYKSYFPLAVQKLTNQNWVPVIVYELAPGDQIKIRNMEIIPADSVLCDTEAFIDYSFVTGESKPVHVRKGELIYAGGRLLGQPVEMIVEKKTSQSHLTGLWNRESFQKDKESKYKQLIDRVARWFTWSVILLALITAIYWYKIDSTQMWLVLTAVLMVACPCAMALSAPFTYGNMMRIFGKQGLYLKNADVVERMAKVDAIVFDKTGTITRGASEVNFVGVLEEIEWSYVFSLTSSSSHPLSKLIANTIHTPQTYRLYSFKEITGKGLEAVIDGKKVRVGSADFTGHLRSMPKLATYVFVSIDEQVRGYFTIHTSFRPQLRELVKSLGKKCVALISGDQNKEESHVRDIFPDHVQLIFNQSPHQKMDFISALQKQGRIVMMLGDGLNDSGALKQSDVGIAVTDDTGIFSPACDAIMQGDQFANLNTFINLCRGATTVLKISFGISFFYNAIALGFAVSGTLSPLVAAILMPISSISVVGFSTLSIKWIAAQKFHILK